MKSLSTIGLAIGAVLAVSAPAWAEGDAAAGQATFMKKCKACHTIEPGKHGMGPSLAGMVGAKIASADGYTKYQGLAGKDGVWDDATLDAFLTDSKAFAGGKSAMPVKIGDAGERANLIAYMKTLK